MGRSVAVALAVLGFGATTSPLLGEDDLTVLPAEIDGQPTRTMLRRSLEARAKAAFAQRRQRYERLKTAEDVTSYQESMRSFLLERLGEFPDRTPLNAEQVGVIERDDCTIEKIVFESRPKHYVTGLYYRPKSAPPYPGVIVPCGHTSNGKAAGSYQKLCLLLARNGIAAFCYDPIGQGERYQLLDDEGKPRFKSTDEHTLVGVGSILVGRSTAHYRIWDGIRALDYLAARDDVDPKRLGCTGNSGGGTLTQYLMAIDDRIACAAPSCCVTTFDRRIANNTIGDAEQNVFGQIAFGLDHADYTLMRAPKPTLYGTATHDFMDIEGSWDIFREAKRVYTRLGYAERVDLIEVDGKHGYTKPKREAAVRWLSRWLLDRDEPITEPELQTLATVDLLCTPRGQVGLIGGARSVMDFNTDLTESRAAARRELWNQDPKKALERVRELTGMRSLEQLPRVEPERRGVVERDGYRIEKLVFNVGDGLVLPGLLFVPGKPRGDRFLSLHGDGKAAGAAPGGAVEKRVERGHAVLAIDLRGLGETGPSSRGVWGGGWSEIWMSYLLGDTLVGRRAEDVLVATMWFGKWDVEPGQNRRPVLVEAEGVTTVPALHAVAAAPHLYGGLAMTGGPRTWNEVVRDPTARGRLVHAVHGALDVYDLPNLAEWAGWHVPAGWRQPEGGPEQRNE